MKWKLAGSGVAVAAAVAALAVWALPGLAASSPQAQVGRSATTSLRVLTLRAAQRAANVALAACARRGIPVTASVVDRDGVELATLRDEHATGATVAVATAKAFASAGFQTPSGQLGQAAKSTPGLIAIPNFSVLPGGEPISIGKTLLGGIGVSGAPSGDIDDLCAKAGLAAID
jgi:uncharacterized protein GlcG (DUF336 family)